MQESAQVSGRVDSAAAAWLSCPALGCSDVAVASAEQFAGHLQVGTVALSSGLWPELSATGRSKPKEDARSQNEVVSLNQGLVARPQRQSYACLAKSAGTALAIFTLSLTTVLQFDRHFPGKALLYVPYS